MSNYTKIALTGGPNGGKSSSLASIAEHLQERGHKIFIVPEAATILLAAGITPKQVGGLKFQEMVLDTIVHLEGLADIAAEAIYKQTGKKPIIICDRGVMDGIAYCSRDEYLKILKSRGLNSQTARDERYDAVIHMITSPEAHYSNATNQHRSETYAQAVALDKRTRESWVGHPHFKIIDNSTDFPTKLKRVNEIVCNVLGEPIPLEAEKKLLVEIPSLADLEKEVGHIEDSLILQDYMLDKGARVRKRTTEGSTIYTHTVKGPQISAGVRPEEERIISKEEYNQLLKKKDPEKGTIIKTRKCFVYENHQFELDVYEQPDGLTVLEIEVSNIDEKIELPKSILVIKDVTTDESYSNNALASRVYHDNTPSL